jgi:hypothetical protein
VRFVTRSAAAVGCIGRTRSEGDGTDASATAAFGSPRPARVRAFSP